MLYMQSRASLNWVYVINADNICLNDRADTYHSHNLYRSVVHI